MNGAGDRSTLGQLWSRARAGLRALDAALAGKALHDFEIAHGLDLNTPHVLLADVAAVVRALTPDDRPVIEHHWSTLVPTAVEGLARVAAIAAGAGRGADVVGVVWDLADDTSSEPAEAIRARVEAFCAERAIGWPNLVVRSGRDALAAGLGMPVPPVPSTRVRDVDNGVLRTFSGALSEHDVDVVLALVAR